MQNKVKNFFCSKHLIQFQCDANKTCRIMNKVMVKARKKQPLLSQKIILNNITVNKENE